MIKYLSVHKILIFLLHNVQNTLFYDKLQIILYHYIDIFSPLQALQIPNERFNRKDSSSRTE